MAPVSTESKRRGQIGHKLVGAGKADLGVVDAEGRHALQQADRVGHGDIEVGLLHPVAKAGFKQLDFSGSGLFHFSLTPILQVLFAEYGLAG